MDKPIIIITTIEGEDLVERFGITGATFTDSVEKTNQLNFSFKLAHNEVWRLNDASFLKQGQQLKFQFGYAGGDMSRVHLVEIQDVKPQYAGQITVNVTATDLGYAMKKLGTQKIWGSEESPIKASDIATQIAGFYSLKSEVEESDIEYTGLAQAGRKDHFFLVELAKEQKSGNFIFYVDGDILYFGTRKLGEKPVKIFDYADPDSGILSFNPKYQATKSTGATAGTKSTTVSEEKAVSEEATTSENTKDETQTAKEKLIFYGNK